MEAWRSLAEADMMLKNDVLTRWLSTTFTRMQSLDITGEELHAFYVQMQNILMFIMTWFPDWCTLGQLKYFTTKDKMNNTFDPKVYKPDDGVSHKTQLFFLGFPWKAVSKDVCVGRVLHYAYKPLAYVSAMHDHRVAVLFEDLPRAEANVKKNAPYHDRFRVVLEPPRDFNKKYKALPFALAFAYYLQAASPETFSSYLQHFHFLVHNIKYSGLFQNA